jgi:hypothetical protein
VKNNQDRHYKHKETTRGVWRDVMNQERTHTCERNIKGIFKNRNKMLLVVVFKKPTYAEALDF